MNLHELKMNLIDLLQNLDYRIDEIATLYRNREIATANERFAFLTEDAEVVLEAARLLLDSYPFFDIDELNEKLAMLLQQIESQDYLYIADLLSLELKPLFLYWGEQLQDA